MSDSPPAGVTLTAEQAEEAAVTIERLVGCTPHIADWLTGDASAALALLRPPAAEGTT